MDGIKARPILFSAPMVRALLAGSKTQTRRVAKLNESGRVAVAGKNWHCGDPAAYLACPYGQPGDQLLVREAWRADVSLDHTKPRNIPPKSRIVYEADHPEDHLFGGKYRPGMFMPLWASRITLEIVSVRVERVQDISEADAIAEGIDQRTGDKTIYHFDFSGQDDRFNISGYKTAKSAYKELWESINGAGSWDANPWVWVVEFDTREGQLP